MRRRGQPKQRMLPQLRVEVLGETELQISKSDVDILAIHCPDTVKPEVWRRYVAMVSRKARQLGREPVVFKHKGGEIFAVKPNRKSIVGYRWKQEVPSGRYIVIV